MKLSEMIAEIEALDATRAPGFWLVLLAACADLARSNYNGIRAGDSSAIELNQELNESIRRFAKRAAQKSTDPHDVSIEDLLVGFAQRMNDCRKPRSLRIASYSISPRSASLFA